MEKIVEGKFDVLFLCHGKDKDVFKKSLEYAKKNVIGYRKIFLLSKEKLCKDKDVDFISEDVFPFTKDGIAEYVPSERAGWYYQQFLKLYFLKVMGKKALDNVLIIDADTIFLKKTKFFENKKPLYNVEVGYYQPYYDILKKVFGFGRQHPHYSGITHHMVFQRKYINEIFELAFRNGKNEFWKKIMENIDKDVAIGNSFSEYDLYFYYMLRTHSDKIKIRKLKFINFPYYHAKWIRVFKFFRYDYLSAHDYLREKKLPILSSLSVEFLRRIGLKRVLKRVLEKLRVI